VVKTQKIEAKAPYLLEPKPKFEKFEVSTYGTRKNVPDVTPLISTPASRVKSNVVPEIPPYERFKIKEIPKIKPVVNMIPPYARYEEPAQVVITKTKAPEILPYVLQPEPKFETFEISPYALPPPPIERSTKTTVQSEKVYAKTIPTTDRNIVTIPKKKTSVLIEDSTPTIIKEVTGKSDVKNIPAFLIEPDIVNASPKGNLSGVFANLDTGLELTAADNFPQDWGWGWTDPTKEAVLRGGGSGAEIPIIQGIDPKILMLAALGILLLVVRK